MDNIKTYFALYWDVNEYEEVSKNFCLGIYTLESCRHDVVEIRKGNYLFSFIMVMRPETEDFIDKAYIADHPFCIRDDRDILRCYLRKDLWKKWNIVESEDNGWRIKDVL